LIIVFRSPPRATAKCWDCTCHGSHFSVDGEPDTERLGLKLVDEANLGIAPGDAFGEVALLNQFARTASIEAVQNSTLISITSAALQKLVVEQPALASQFLYHVARSMGRQLGDVTTKLRARSEQKDLISFLQ